MADLKNKRIITIATTGAWPKKENNPNVPLTPAEIAEDVYQCWKLGASICHLHMRDDDGNGTMDIEKFRETIKLIRAHEDCDIIINTTTSGDLNATEETRLLPMQELKPELATFDCGTMNWSHSSIFENSPSFLTKSGLLMQELGVKPEVEVFDPGMIYNAKYFLKKGVLKAPVHFQLCMGVANGIAGTVKNLVFMKETMDEVAPGSTWSAFGVGASSMPIMYATVALGGHLRVGMEDNVEYAYHQLAESNMQFVARARRVIEEFAWKLPRPTRPRQILGLK